jgi:hypothetical protein
VSEGERAKARGRPAMDAGRGRRDRAGARETGDDVRDDDRIREETPR